MGTKTNHDNCTHVNRGGHESHESPEHCPKAPNYSTNEETLVHEKAEADPITEEIAACFHEDEKIKKEWTENEKE